MQFGFKDEDKDSEIIDDDVKVELVPESYFS
jgi:hypothetical protein